MHLTIIIKRPERTPVLKERKKLIDMKIVIDQLKKLGDLRENIALIELSSSDRIPLSIETMGMGFHPTLPCVSVGHWCDDGGGELLRDPQVIFAMTLDADGIIEALEPIYFRNDYTGVIERTNLAEFAQDWDASLTRLGYEAAK